MSRITATRARVINSKKDDEHFVFFKVSQPDYPENYVVETRDGLVNYIDDLEGDEEEVFVTPTYMSVKEYNALPEFDGF